MAQRHTMNDELAKAIASVTVKSEGAARAKTVAVDLFRAAGWIHTDFISPKSDGSTASEESFKWLNEQIVAGFSKTVQGLLAANPNTLKEEEKVTRRYAQMQIGARRSDFKKALKPKSEGGRNKPTLEFLDEHAHAIVKRLEATTGDDAPNLDIPAAREVALQLRQMFRTAAK